MGERVPDKNRCITVNLFHDGVFTVRPFEYAVSDVKQITDIQFEEHSGYDVLDIRDQGKTMANDGNESSDAYCSSDEEDLCYVDFHSELDDNVVINIVTTNDPFLNKLCGDNAEFINLVDEPVNANVETVEEDTENIDHVFNVKEGISYVTHDPNRDWKKIELILGMRFHHPEQLKLCVENYGVANGYPLWFYRNDWRKLLVYCGRDVESVTTRSRSKSGEGTSKSPKTPVKLLPLVRVVLSHLSGPKELLGGLKEEGERVSEAEEVVREEDEGVREEEEGSDRYMIEDKIRKNLEHEYMEDMLLQEEQKFDAYQSQQDEFDQEALRYILEEEARFKRQDEKRLKEQLAEQEWERNMDYYHPSNLTQEEESFEVEPYNRNLTIVDANVQTQESVVANISDKGEIGFRLGDFEAEDNYKSNADLEIPSEEPIAAVTPSVDKG
ncbi:hypothetical protein Tco_0735156 [Tanacetum coccineum]